MVSTKGHGRISVQEGGAAAQVRWRTRRRAMRHVHLNLDGYTVAAGHATARLGTVVRGALGTTAEVDLHISDRPCGHSGSKEAESARVDLSRPIPTASDGRCNGDAHARGSFNVHSAVSL